MKLRSVTAIAAVLMLTGCSSALPGTSGTSSLPENSISSNVRGAELAGINSRIPYADCSVTGCCEITDDEMTVSTTYKGKIPAKTVPAEDFGSFAEELLYSGEYSQTDLPFTVDCYVMLKAHGDTIVISSGTAEQCDASDPENITIDQLPAMRIKDGEDMLTYLVPYEMKNSFGELVASAVAVEENIRNVHRYKDWDYYSIEDTGYPHDKIIMLSVYDNYAEEPVLKGSFADTSGYIYTFDMSGRDIISEAMEHRQSDDYVPYQEALLDALYYEVYYKQVPAAHIPDDEDVFDTWLDCKLRISPDARFFEENVACDAGEDALYCLDDGELVKLRCSGDNEGYLDDCYARKLCDAWDRWVEEDPVN